MYIPHIKIIYPLMYTLGLLLPFGIMNNAGMKTGMQIPL